MKRVIFLCSTPRCRLYYLIRVYCFEVLFKSRNTSLRPLTACTAPVSCFPPPRCLFQPEDPSKNPPCSHQKPVGPRDADEGGVSLVGGVLGRFFFVAIDEACRYSNQSLHVRKYGIWVACFIRTRASFRTKLSFRIARVPSRFKRSALRGRGGGRSSSRVRYEDGILFCTRK